jgi:hypothetical protein
MQGFDWEAAADAIENISLVGDQQRNHEKATYTVQENQNSIINKGKCEIPVVRAPLINSKLQQKSILNFVQRPSSSSVDDSRASRPNQYSVNKAEEKVQRSIPHSVNDSGNHSERPNQHFVDDSSVPLDHHFEDDTIGFEAQSDWRSDSKTHSQQRYQQSVSYSNQHNNYIIDNDERCIDVDAAKTWIYPGF